MYINIDDLPEEMPVVGSVDAAVQKSEFAISDHDYRECIVKTVNEFLYALEESKCSVGNSCKVSGLTRVQAGILRGKIARMDEVWTSIYESVTDEIEDAAFTRAVKGVSKGIFYQGECVDYEQVYSDSLLTLLLQSRRPDVYKQRVQSDDNKTGELNFNVVLQNVP